MCLFNFNDFNCNRYSSSLEQNDKSRSFISIGSVFTTILQLLFPLLWDLGAPIFSQYNQLYGSIERC
jgi:uncharacterized BrkB/YihY/UPF0761 family membrane protein